jgi:hypothetical protein
MAGKPARPLAGLKVPGLGALIAGDRTDVRVSLQRR